jgi:hypothetical protein
VSEFNGYEISNESNLEWNGGKSIIGQELQKGFAPKVESMENTDQFSKDETLIEEKSIITQELILEGMECLKILILRKIIFLWKIMINLPKMKSLVIKNSPVI